MKFRFTIGRKIGAGFGVLVFLTLIIFILTNITLFRSKHINDQIINLYAPSVAALEDLNQLMIRSKMLITNWVFIQSPDDNLNKDQLRTLIKDEYPEKIERISKLAANWEEEERLKIDSIFEKVSQLFEMHGEVMTQLNSFESYEDAMAVFMVRPMVEDGEIEYLTTEILDELGAVISSHKIKAESVSDQMVTSFDNLQLVVRVSGLILIIGGIIIAFLTVRSIVRPVQKLKVILLSLGKGIFPKGKIEQRNDEIGEMSNALQNLVAGLKRTTEFSKEVGAGNFGAKYEPLSNEDTLGHALLKMNDDLRELTTNLEDKVKERTIELHKKNEQITDSINYAKRIQGAIIPSIELVHSTFPDSFIIYKPKDIVSGDFPWIFRKDDTVFVAAVDCTGHGVPGAFMSLIGNFLLNEIVKEKKVDDPAEILNLLNKVLIKTLHQDTDSAETKDGMDIALCKISLQTNIVEYAGAFRPLINMQNDKLSEIPGDNIFIGSNDFNLKKTEFTKHSIHINAGESIYIFSDGYADQFGGPKNKKFKVKQLQELLVNNQDLDMLKLGELLENKFEDWKGNGKQTDDVLMIGVRF